MAKIEIVNGARRYAGQYVTVKEFGFKTVITHGKRAADVVQRAAKKGIHEPVLIFVHKQKMVYIF